MGRINLLNPLLSSRIAAGEVIERPQSILRELLDNALDANASQIDVEIEGGGIDLISVSDDGSGIRRDDLALLGSRHATSKLHNPEDLYAINTLGFRGEALYSISAVTRMAISTRSNETNEGSTLTIDNGIREPITSLAPDSGTIVKTENLFRDIPARRAFLKRASTEAQACRNLLVSKALPFPDVRFTMKIDGALRLDWPRVATLKERVMYLYRQMGIADGDVKELVDKQEDFSIVAICANSSVKRSDRKEIRIYVNNRPVDEYSLVQAVSYGYGELLPGGSFPYCAVFITDKAELVDFNIHPAKKEVKLRNLADIHHSLTTLLKSGVDRIIPEIKIQNQFYIPGIEDSEGKSKETIQAKNIERQEKEIPNSNFVSEKVQRTYQQKDKDWLEKAKALERMHSEIKAKSNARDVESTTQFQPKEEIIYIGQAFKLFLICQVGDCLYIIDQHAAHERILYDEILSLKSVQPLLVPIKIEVDDLTDEFLSKMSYVYTKMGVMLSKKAKGEWEIDALPAVCKSIESQIVDFITTAKADEDELESKLFAIIACKAAIKAGDDIDRWAAVELIKKVFQLDQPCCPHGRTFLIKLKESELRQMVGRTK